MDKSDVNSLTTAVATGIGAAAAESAFHSLGVITMGAFGGALFALMKMPKMGLGDGVRFMAPRSLVSFFCSWIAVSLVQGVLDAHHYDVPRTAVLLFMSFFLACPRELTKDLEPIWKPALAFFRRGNSSKE